MKKLQKYSYRCIFADCPYAQVAFPGWVAKQSLVTHINNVHLASGCMPTEQMLQCLGRAICYRCKVLMTSRGCPHCKGRILGEILLYNPIHESAPLLSLSPASGISPFQLAQYDTFLAVFGRNGQMSSCLRQCVTAPTVETFHRLFCFPKLTLSATWGPEEARTSS